ncbi:MAG: 50S ribosomal protein L10 [Candidatus Omnitrophota bacterium]
MKRIGVVVREKIVDEIKENIKESEGCFFLNFNKVKARSVSQLRNNLRTTGANIYVAKNSLFEKAFDDKKENLNNFISQETAVVFIHDKDIVKTCKALVDFAKENEILQIKGGFIKDKPITTDEVSALSKLPPKEVLLGMAVSGIASPLTSFVSTLNQVVLKFVWAIDGIKKSKEVSKPS